MRTTPWHSHHGTAHVLDTGCFPQIWVPMIHILIWIWYLVPLMYRCKFTHKIKPPPHVGMGHWIQTSWEMPSGVSSQWAERTQESKSSCGPKATNTPQCTQTAHDSFHSQSGTELTAPAGRCRQGRQRRQEESQVPVLNTQQPAIRTAAIQD